MRARRMAFLTNGGGGIFDVDAYTLAPGLIAHRTLPVTARPNCARSLNWTIAHARSGHAITGARDLAHAKQLIAKLAPLTDWTQNERSIVAAGIGAKVRDVLAL